MDLWRPLREGLCRFGEAWAARCAVLLLTYCPSGVPCITTYEKNPGPGPASGCASLIKHFERIFPGTAEAVLGERVMESTAGHCPVPRFELLVVLPLLLAVAA